ncbi:MAG: hypothetical protein CMM01_16280 [Rhodopirellula sp.]|nr:hypothetical protein [Rhodopirellula sp.]
MAVLTRFERSLPTHETMGLAAPLFISSSKTAFLVRETRRWLHFADAVVVQTPIIITQPSKRGSSGTQFSARMPQ